MSKVIDLDEYRKRREPDFLIQMTVNELRRTLEEELLPVQRELDLLEKEIKEFTEFFENK